jgi:HSP20 family protein
VNDLAKQTGRTSVPGLFGDDFDNLFQGFFRPLSTMRGDAGGTFSPALDITEDEKVYNIRAELPGVKREDIDITVHDGVLTISAETRAEDTQKDGERIIRQERRYGRYVRSLRLGALADNAAVSANYKDGVLSVVVPKTAATQPKRVKVEPT